MVAVGTEESIETDEDSTGETGPVNELRVTESAKSFITIVPSVEQVTVKLTDEPLDADTAEVEQFAVPLALMKSEVEIPLTVDENATVYVNVLELEFAPGLVTVAVGAAVSIVTALTVTALVGPVLVPSVTVFAFIRKAKVPSVVQVTVTVNVIPWKADTEPIEQVAVPEAFVKSVLSKP